MYKCAAYTKYNNVKVVVDGHKFDSVHESQRYCELKMLQRAGEIHDLELQKQFVLIPAQYEYFPRYGKDGKRLKDGKRCVERQASYYADFYYITKDGCEVVEDAKSEATKTPVYELKKKLMLQVYGIKIREV